MPTAFANEFGFGSSSSMTTVGSDVWFGSGGAQARIFHSRDGGYTWDVRSTPIVHNPAHGAGIFSVAFRTRELGLAVGGDLDDPAQPDVAAFSILGSPWTAPGREPSGLRSSVAWLPSTLATAVTVGPNGV